MTYKRINSSTNPDTRYIVTDQLRDEVWLNVVHTADDADDVIKSAGTHVPRAELLEALGVGDDQIKADLAEAKREAGYAEMGADQWRRRAEAAEAERDEQQDFILAIGRGLQLDNAVGWEPSDAIAVALSLKVETVNLKARAERAEAKLVRLLNDPDARELTIASARARESDEARLAAINRAEAAEAKARDLEIERNMLRSTLEAVHVRATAAGAYLQMVAKALGDAK